jgi:hypothetical protein
MVNTYFLDTQVLNRMWSGGVSLKMPKTTSEFCSKKCKFLTKDIFIDHVCTLYKVRLCHHGFHTEIEKCSQCLNKVDKEK